MKKLLACLFAVCMIFSVGLSDEMVTWDHTGMDVLGNPDVLSSVEYAIFLAGGTAADSVLSITRDLSQPGAPLPPGSTANRADTLDVSTLQAGIYGFSARVFDVAGNASSWTQSSDTFDLAPPAPPTNLSHIKVTVTVEIITPGN